MKKIFLLFGPTACGKTSIAIELGRKLPIEIISADSMQVYKYMDIGTAKPSLEERKNVKHYLIDIVYPDEEWNASFFVKNANEIVNDLIKNGKIPLIVGGTGLYLNAFINNFSFPIASPNQDIRNELSKKSTKELFEILKKVDLISSKKIMANDKKRIIRALEVYYQTGKPISKLQHQNKRDDLFLIFLTDNRENIYERINKRVDKMYKEGLIDEVKKLLDMGYDKNLISMQALGYKETIDYLEGKLSKNETIELVKKRTRNFAKRQLSWFKRFSPNVTIDLTDTSKDPTRTILDLIKNEI